MSLSSCRRLLRFLQPKLSLPNIIIIFTDDQGYADVGCYGAEGFQTPTLDHLARHGMQFTNFYVSQAVCSASRASLLTGCYAERVSVHQALRPWSMVGLNPEEETIADLLKRRGYATAIFGKWHLGSHPEFLPLQHGFDEYFGLPYSNDMWPVDYDGIPVKEKKSSKNQWLRIFPSLPLIENNRKIEEIETLEEQAALTRRYTQRAVNFIRNNQKQPFFLYLPHTMPHIPLAVSNKFKGKSKQGLYGDVIMELDWSVKQILQTLKKQALEENTLLIFASDNGPWLNFGNHAGSAGILREGKGTTWEGGTRVPCIMYWPGTIPAGKVCDQMAATIDLLPTITAVTGAALPQKKIDGINILPLLKGKKELNPRDHYFYYYNKELRAVRKGDWKLVFPHAYRSYENVAPGHNGYPGPRLKRKTGLELYNLAKDVGETHDIVNKNPQVVREMQSIANQMRNELGDLLQKKEGHEIRPPGRIGPQKKENVAHLAVEKKITLSTPYHQDYTGGGQIALIDGIKGTAQYTDGAWQGYKGHDIQAVVDLKNSYQIKRISCRFLENQFVLIFLPVEINIFISEDGGAYKLIKQYFNNVTKNNELPSIREFPAVVNQQWARFIKLYARNINICPQWHPYSGEKAWLFMDEIVVN